MITKQDLLEAIAECQGVRSPNANTAIKLAAFYTILDHLDDKEQPVEQTVDSVPRYSLAGPDADVIQIDSGSEFAQVVNGRKQSDVWPVIDELMATIKALNSRLYSGVLRKLSQ